MGFENIEDETFTMAEVKRMIGAFTGAEPTTGQIVDAVNGEAPTRKRRGRKPMANDGNEPRRKRGRPRKNPPGDTVAAEASTESNSGGQTAPF